MAKAVALKIVDGNYTECDASQATHIRLLFPVEFEPLKQRIIPVQTSGTREGTPNWTWNGSLDSPTLRPSILTRWEGGDPLQKIACHSYIEDGVVSFLYDSTHELSGKSRPLLEV